MALLSALELAYLRKQFFSTLSGEELVSLAAQLAAATAAANAAAEGAQTAADAAAATANARATVGYVDQSVAGLASEAYVGAAVEGLATEDYVDGKFADGKTSDTEIEFTADDGDVVTLKFTGGLLTVYSKETPP
jgi:hypothetical protein